jgi:hypothetical protein
MPRRISARLRQIIIERASGCCEYCISQERYSPVAFSIEHVVPRSRSGSHAEDNLAFACQECNNHKYNKVDAVDPVTQETVLLYHPRQHVWSEHFVWSDDFALLLGISAIGRATVETLYLNRPPLVNLRHILHKLGKHPPL